ncbi:MAG TPA: DinB family protein [Candidatus Hydrogenedentes bacterium]|nr:DinB family protein [Candidatus Hydrogenedentota bacterium]HOS02439.1 DinB family protein [Candidatus Hydrogenedentota bacterium]
MIHALDEFFQTWAGESDATLKMLRALTDASLAQPIAPGHRTLGRIAWHIALTIREMMERTGLAIDGPAPDAPMPEDAKAIADAYETSSRSLVDAIQRNWTDASLAVEDNLYGGMWTRATTLSVLVNHQIHHRGQMTALMRQAGLRVPGIYGPAQEDWASMGMEPLP